MISMDRKYVTRDGRPVRILATDRPHSVYPVVALVGHEQREIETYTASGKYNEDVCEQPMDLVEVPEEAAYVRMLLTVNDVRRADDAFGGYPRQAKIAVTYCLATREVQAEFVK